MTVYREVDPTRRHQAVITEACRIRDILDRIPTVYNIAGRIGPCLQSSREIVDVLSRCIEELSS